MKTFICYGTKTTNFKNQCKPARITVAAVENGNNISIGISVRRDDVSDMKYVKENGRAMAIGRAIISPMEVISKTKLKNKKSIFVRGKNRNKVIELEIPKPKTKENPKGDELTVGAYIHFLAEYYEKNPEKAIIAIKNKRIEAIPPRPEEPPTFYESKI